MITLSPGPDALRIRWPDGLEALFPHVWLQDSDPAGFHPQTGERAFDLTTADLGLAPEAAAVEGNALALTWPGRAPSRYDLAWLRENRPGRRRPDPAAAAPVIWRADLGAAGVPRHDAAAVMSDDAALLAWLRDTRIYGLSLIDGLADDAEAGMQVARRAGHLRETNFGLTFEVMSKPDPNNLAYTADALPLHTDLPNQELVPGVQMLHCIANEAEGGGSTFCDGFAVAEALRQADRAAFDLLAATPIPFRFQDGAADIRARKPTIVLDGDGAVSEICFNAHIADILDLPPEEMPAFYRAYRAFMALLRDPGFTVALKLRAGEMVCFDNRRALHGRERFDPSTGFRRLRGAYVDRGDWDSRIRVLSRGG